MSFWENSTDEQKLAQIDGGIECNMTIRQIAANCGTTHAKLAYFGRTHGRKFPALSAGSPIRKAAGARGGSVRKIMVARASGASNIHMQDAFSIFGSTNDADTLLFGFGGDR
ncbi:hypothetical protein [Rhizobium sp. WW_1]|uniref:hypothetical protein n=1 Tax=Rhizobium sp. WW_1 TaxID=1907375 RepID=UPI00064907FE|nr:hypothetical protein [Rhizobium sp. WW_1]RKD69001.1 hypothetical protein BJ928_104139 [Rhizobium sp. WW_1]